MHTTGSGKTTELARVALKLIDFYEIDTSRSFHLEPLPVQVVGSTGTASANLGVCTLHGLLCWRPVPTAGSPGSLEGCGPESQEVQRFLDVNLAPAVLRVLASLEHLLVSEAHRIDQTMWVALDAALRRAKRTRVKWGGVQLVMEGDFLQLTDGIPLFAQADFNDSFKVICLPTQYRSNGALDSLLRALSMRKEVDALPLEIVGQLSSLKRPLQRELSDVAVHLFGKLESTKAYNVQENGKLPGDPVLYRGVDIADDNAASAALDRSTNLSAEPLPLKLQSRVMLLTNELSRKYPGLCSGALGEVVKLPELPEVQLLHSGFPLDSPDFAPSVLFRLRSGAIITVPIPAITRESGGSSRTALPLALAFGLTVHRAAGLTLPAAVLHADTLWPLGGLAYTGLSRVRSMDHVQITGSLRLNYVFSREDCVDFLRGQLAAISLGDAVQSPYAAISVRLQGACRFKRQSASVQPGVHATMREAASAGGDGAVDSLELRTKSINHRRGPRGGGPDPDESCRFASGSHAVPPRRRRSPSMPPEAGLSGGAC